MIKELNERKEALDKEFTALADHQWVANRLQAIKVEYDTIDGIIKNLESESKDAATSTRSGRQKSDQNSNS